MANSLNKVTTKSILDATVATADIADDAITSAKIADDAIVAAGIADNAVVTAAINADAVTGAKIADDAINSEHYTDGSIDTAHIAADQITGALIADDAVGAEHIEQLDADLSFADNVKSSFGAGADLKIWHNSSDNSSYIRESGSGSLFLDASRVNINNAASSEHMATFIEDGAVDLYHDNSKKLATTQYGIEVHGSADNARIAFGDAYSNSRIGYVGLNRFGIDAHDGLEVRDVSDSYATRFKIDENGYVTKPAQPYAKIHFNHASAGGVDSSSLVKQDSVASSTVRNGMSHTTGRITVPIAGTYLVYAHNNNYESGSAHMSIRVNGSTINGGNAQMADTSEIWKSMSVMTVLDLSASDYVESWLEGKQDNATWNSFIVTLLS